MSGGSCLRACLSAPFYTIYAAAVDGGELHFLAESDEPPTSADHFPSWRGNSDTLRSFCSNAETSLHTTELDLVADGRHAPLYVQFSTHLRFRFFMIYANSLSVC